MPAFIGGPAYATPFGRNNFLRSTKDFSPEHYTFAASTLPAVTIDGYAGQKVLQPGTVIAKILTGGDAGKVGVFDRGAAGGVAAIGEVKTFSRTSTGGTIAVVCEGVTSVVTCSASAAGFTAANLLAAIYSLPQFGPGAIQGVVTGAAGGPLVFTTDVGVDAPAITIDNTSATGGTVTVVETSASAAAVAGSGAATDGRSDYANIVGLCNTFLPWQLMVRDVEIAVLYDCTAVQGWCIEYANGVAGALTNATADQMRGQKGLDIHFK